VGRWDEALLVDQLAGVPLDTHSLCWVDGSSDVLFYFKTEQHYSGVYQRATLPEDLQARYARLAEGADILLLAGSRHVEIRHVFAQVAAAAPARWKVFAPNYALALFDREELAVILATVDLVSVNEAELQGLLRCLGLTEVRALQRVTPAAILETRASDGARLHTAASVLELPSLSGRGGDVVGAGDAFLSGMLHGLHAGLPPDEAASYGSRAAASFVRAEAWKLLRDCADFKSNPLATPRA
jgi:sugar/nucleoside kinase (ribokinase family)